MKRKISILFVSLILSGCIDKLNTDCSLLINRNLISEFKVSNVYLGEKRFSKYLSDEEEYHNKLIELQTQQVEDTLVVKFLKLGKVEFVELNKPETQ